MDYLELVTKFEKTQKIPYDELLNTTEWKERRINIIQRDKSCCTNCGKTQSIYHMNFNISFQSRDKLISQSVVYQNKSVDSVKTELGIEKIHVLKSPHNESTHCGITENGLLFLANWEQAKETSKTELVINKGTTQSGRTFLIIGKLGQKYFDNTFSIPFISEKSVVMHVHHKFYIKEKLPWEYDNEALITLCNWCHWELHEQTKVPIYTMINGELHELNYTPCYRCNGAGVLPEFKHVQNGVCFRCNGSRYEQLITSELIL